MLVFFSNNQIINLIFNTLLTVFIVFLIIVAVLSIIMILTTIKIEFKYINNNYKLIIKLYILGKIRYLKIELNKEKILKIINKARNKILEKDYQKVGEELYKDRNVIKILIKKLKINLNYLNLDLKIGTEFILLTTVIIITISTIFPMLVNKFIKKYDEKKYNYKFTPIYNKNAIKLQLHCIISVKIVHIISVILKITFKKGVFKNVRASNTRFNDNCYE